MSDFRPQGSVTATFDDTDLGRVEDLDVGTYEAPDEAEFQFYVFSVAAKRDIVHFTLAAPLSVSRGRLAELRLADLYGARYRTLACFIGCEKLEAGGFRHTFESQGEVEVRAPATKRHGAGDLASALLLDALNEHGKKQE